MKVTARSINSIYPDIVTNTFEISDIRLFAPKALHLALRNITGESYPDGCKVTKISKTVNLITINIVDLGGNTFTESYSLNEDNNGDQNNGNVHHLR